MIDDAPLGSCGAGAVALDVSAASFCGADFFRRGLGASRLPGAGNGADSTTSWAIATLDGGKAVNAAMTTAAAMEYKDIVNSGDL